MNGRACPSCQARLSPLAVECPVCGLAFSAPARARPFLFQARALAARPLEEAPVARPALRAPALGRVASVQVEAAPEDLARLAPEGPVPEAPAAPAPRPALGPDAPGLSLWPLVALEACEALLLGTLLFGALTVVALQMGTTLGRLLSGAWPYVLPFALILAWATLMVPLVLANRSPFMALLGLLLAEDQPLRRLNFSLLHLASVALFPLSFLCLVLSPRHQTLGELLSGMEIIARPTPRLR